MSLFKGSKEKTTTKKQTDIHRHGPKPSSNSSQPPNPPPFSLSTSFKDTYSYRGIQSGQIFRTRCYCKDSQKSTFCRYVTYKNIEIVKFFFGEKWSFYKLPNFKLVTENKKLPNDLKYNTVAAGIITLLRR